MKFHEQKMREINKVIDSLWQKTYSGLFRDECSIPDFFVCILFADVAIFFLSLSLSVSLSDFVFLLFLSLLYFIGSDIDTIRINFSQGKRINQPVLYQLVMRKGNMDMEMRGRCSAGQKVSSPF